MYLKEDQSIVGSHHKMKQADTMQHDATRRNTMNQDDQDETRWHHMTTLFSPVLQPAQASCLHYITWNFLALFPSLLRHLFVAICGHDCLLRSSWCQRRHLDSKGIWGDWHLSRPRLSQRARSRLDWAVAQQQRQWCELCWCPWNAARVAGTCSELSAILCICRGWYVCVQRWH